MEISEILVNNEKYMFVYDPELDAGIIFVNGEFYEVKFDDYQMLNTCIVDVFKVVMIVDDEYMAISSCSYNAVKILYVRKYIKGIEYQLINIDQDMINNNRDISQKILVGHRIDENGLYEVKYKDSIYKFDKSKLAMINLLDVFKNNEIPSLFKEYNELKSKFAIQDREKFKEFRSKEFNYDFNKITGYYEQWGETYETDPQRNPHGPVIADIEVVNKCKGPGGKLCPFCYKSNTLDGDYMTIDEYKIIFDKLPKTITQIAFGADADLSMNPDIWKIMKYTRDNGVVPNITVADIDYKTADKLAYICGAVAVSWYGIYSDKNICYNSINNLSNAGLDQINMHFMLSTETLPYIDELIHDIKTDRRLRNLNAVVFLSLKQKGRGEKFNGCSVSEFNDVVNKMLGNNIKFGFDSCSQPKFLQSVASDPNLKEYAQMSESCESFSTSIYINEKGIVYPCSFMENMPWDSLNYNDTSGWDLLSDEITSDNFLNKVWNSDRGLTFSSEASKCASCGRGCQLYNV